jgi:hypothetical protein
LRSPALCRCRISTCSVFKRVGDARTGSSPPVRVRVGFVTRRPCRPKSAMTSRGPLPRGRSSRRCRVLDTEIDREDVEHGVVFGVKGVTGRQPRSSEADDRNLRRSCRASRAATRDGLRRAAPQCAARARTPARPPGPVPPPALEPQFGRKPSAAAAPRSPPVTIRAARRSRDLDRNRASTWAVPLPELSGEPSSSCSCTTIALNRCETAGSQHYSRAIRCDALFRASQNHS